MKTNSIIPRTLLVCAFFVCNYYVFAQENLLKNHQEWEKRINEKYPNMGKKNTDGSYSITTTADRTVLRCSDINFSYEATAAFKEPGNLPQPFCESTVTISRNKITVKMHDAVMISPDMSDKPMWSSDGSVYGYISLKPKDPYTKCLGCRGGNKTIKNGGIVVRVPLKDPNEYSYRNASLRMMRGNGNSVCKHSCRRIPIHITSRHPITQERVGGHMDAASDHRSPYRFDHNQTISYSWDEIASKNKKSKEELIRDILENEIVGIGVGGDDEFFSFGVIQSDYVRRFLWNVFGYSENKIKQQVADAENARRERMLLQMNTTFEQANSEYKAGNDKYLSQPEEAYQHFKKAVTQSLDVNKNAIEYDKKEMISSSYELWLHSTQMAVQSSYAVAIKNSQHISAFKEDYKAAKKNLPYGVFGSINENIGNKAFKAGRYEEAIDFFDIAIDSYHSTKEMNQFEHIPSAGKALCLSILGRKNEALDLIDKTLSLCPDEIYPNEVKGRIYIKNGKKKQAKQWWEKTVLPKFKEKAYETKFYKLLMEEGILK